MNAWSFEKKVCHNVSKYDILKRSDIHLLRHVYHIVNINVGVFQLCYCHGDQLQY